MGENENYCFLSGVVMQYPSERHVCKVCTRKQNQVRYSFQGMVKSLGAHTRGSKLVGWYFH
jgi:hypothetical protein